MDFEKRYLGDSVYAEIENGMVKLTTNNGFEDRDTIYLELPVYNELSRYVDYIKGIVREEAGLKGENS